MFLQRHRHHRDLHSFPTRRSSDLRFDGSGGGAEQSLARRALYIAVPEFVREPQPPLTLGTDNRLDRKSTRLNSSHLGISYAVFCLKKKKKKIKRKQKQQTENNINT